jgi:ribosomal protein S18 acetylase RimI-like enzyme
MLNIEPLGKQHDRAGFDCGSRELNQYLRSTARQHLTRGISRTFVLTDEAEPARILGFFTLASCEIRVETLPTKYAKKYPHRVPAAKLARLAVQVDRQGQGLGSFMMVDAMQRIVAVSENLGIIGFFVDAKDDKAQAFYKQFGFIELPDNHLELFLPIATLRQAFKGI